MLINADFSQNVVVAPDDHHWISSPQAGVERVILDRIGAEKARATSLVRYAPGSDFPEHSHPSGEEILVLSGVFSENGIDYPAGCYLRSPDGSSHQPSSREGATLFVKLRQMSADDHAWVRTNTHDRTLWQGEPRRQFCPLYSSQSETVLLQKLADGEPLVQDHAASGAEVLILSGELTSAATRYPTGSWLRFAPDAYPALHASAADTLVYMKTGHLHPTTLVGASS